MSGPYDSEPEEELLALLNACRPRNGSDVHVEVVMEDVDIALLLALLIGRIRSDKERQLNNWS